jgi:uncharacterized cupin superfamily protein
MTKRSNIANLDELAATTEHEGRHQYARKLLGAAAGGQQLGCSHMIVPPGAVSFPFHFHAANEEAIFVIAGRGALRLADARQEIRSGDWIALPVGPSHAHQIVNDSDAPLEYLCISTMHAVDIWGYPDSHKVGFAAAPADKPRERYLKMWVKDDAGVDYYVDEPAARDA